MTLPVIEVELTRQWPTPPVRWMYPRERYVLCELITKIEARIVVEIGVNEGATAQYLLNNCPSILSYTGIEVMDGYQFGFKGQQYERPNRPGHMAIHMIDRFALVVRPRGSFDLLPEELPTVDFMIVDGDHSPDAVRHDATLSRAVVRSGGMIVYHDYKVGDPVSVKPTLDTMLSDGAKLAHIKDTWLALEQR